ncbi:protein CURVATURE THYLAKOID 1C, chloroplastic isoform X2 [Magnolia sinica]|uniref:protein CURVATURE THYLAKOID 1C, chloroplastic isoform X2 n=1 Tax=Magnolia sinica TaxID=86752 RepID=UPI00265AB355|nr:protein CURVATURE THYLAKOID 1C, chloroplastic isoform X2 [Magnolia sinica]
MASTVAIQPPSFLYRGKSTIFKNLRKSPVFAVRESRRHTTIIAKAAGENSDSSTSLSIIKTVQNAWDKSEDRLALAGLGFAAIVAVWASGNLIGAIDKLPLIPTVLEVVGILFSWWFIYRYLLFKPDRDATRAGWVRLRVNPSLT